MNRRRVFGSLLWREQGGIATIQVIFAMPVLLALFLGIYDLSRILYFRAQVRSAATAAAIAAVGRQVLLPIPVPTKFAWGIPVDGVVLDTLHLPNVDWNLLDSDSFSRSLFDGPVLHESATVAKLTGSGVTLESATVYPTRVLPSPFKWVEITASVPAPSGVFTKVLAQSKIQHKACAIAWVRPDYWFVNTWWSKRTLEVFDAALNITSDEGKEPLRYYRLVNCGAEGLGAMVEAVAEAHLAATGDKSAIQLDEMQKQIEELEADNGKHSAKRKWHDGGYSESSKSEYYPDGGRERLETCAEDPTLCQKVERTITCPDGSAQTITAPVKEVEEAPPSDEELQAAHCPTPPDTSGSASGKSDSEGG